MYFKLLALACVLVCSRVLQVSGQLSIEHVGCFLDTPTPDFELKLTSEDLQRANSPEVCAAACAQRGYTVLGLQWGDACWCGHTYGRYGLSQLWPCEEPCPGDCSRTCGGPWTNDVYNITQTGTPGLPSITHEGCYLDAPTSDLTVQLTVEELGQANSPEVCAAACAQRGYSVLGLQWGDVCWCGHTYGRYGLSSLWPCDEPCPGDCSKSCGGPWTNDVYSISSGSDSIVVGTTTHYSQSSQLPLTYMGCWNSTMSGLEDTHAMPGYLTAASCAEHCEGSNYMGLEAGRTCRCGDQRGEYARVMEASCDRRCEGDDEEVCGGSSFVSLFALAQ